MATENQEQKVSAFLEYTVNLGAYNSVKIMGGLTVPLNTGEDDPSETHQLDALIADVRSVLEPVAKEFEKQRVADPPKKAWAGQKSYGRKPAAGGAAPRTRTNGPRPATKPVGPEGAAEEAEGALDIGDGTYAVTVAVDKVYPGQVSKRTGKLGPGTIISVAGDKYDTFDDGLLEIAREGQLKGKRLNIIYEWNEQYQKNSIVEGGVAIFGEQGEQE